MLRRPRHHQDGPAHPQRPADPGALVVVGQGEQEVGPRVVGRAPLRDVAGGGAVDGLPRDEVHRRDTRALGRRGDQAHRAPEGGGERPLVGADITGGVQGPHRRLVLRAHDALARPDDGPHPVTRQARRADVTGVDRRPPRDRTG